MGRIHLLPLLAVLLAGCTAHTDFTYPTIHNPFVDKSEAGKPYVTGVKSPAERRAERLAQVLAAWQARPVKEVPSEFRIGMDDVIEVTYIFFGASDVGDRVISLKRSIPLDGKVTLPWIGSIQVTGLTIGALEEAIRTAGAQYVKEPRVSVTILEYHSAGVLITGAVSKPGVYYLYGNRNSLLDLLAQANGVTWGGQSGSWSGGGIISGELPEELIIFRKRKPGAGAATGARPEAKPEGQASGPGSGEGGGKSRGSDRSSTAQVAKAPAAGPTSPPPASAGRQPTEQQDVVKHLVQEYLGKNEPKPEKGGTQVAQNAPSPQGAQPAGSPPGTSAPDFVNPNVGERERIAVDLRQLLDEGNMLFNVELQNDDIVHIPPVVNKYIYVMGYVEAPGQFVITDRMQVDAVAAIGMAGGLKNTARSEKTVLIRQTEQGSQRVPIDLIKMYEGVRPRVYLQAGDMVVVGTNWWVRLMDALAPSASQIWDKNLKFLGGGTSTSFISH